MSNIIATFVYRKIKAERQSEVWSPSHPIGNMLKNVKIKIFYLIRFVMSWKITNFAGRKFN